MLRFGTFEFDPATGELRRMGADGRSTVVRLEPQPAKALSLLAGKPGEIVSRDELKTALWGDQTHVDFERGIAYAISQVRTALGDSADNPRFIETLPRRGFRFIAGLRDPGTSEPRDHGTPEPRNSGTSELRDRGTSALRNPGTSTRLFFALALLFVGVAAAAWWWFAQDQPVVAVAIFDNETGRPELDQYTAGLSDALVVELGTLDTTRIGVVGNARALRMPRSYRDLNEIRVDTGATFIILAQLQTTDTGLRLLVHLIRLSDGRHVWVERINRPATAEGLTEIEQQLLRETLAGVRTHVLGDTETP
jgi:DNA-binding winged helix-turn-helix (wHTH) protein/TolB-like protein